jgi:hypothetical protein
MTREEFFNKIVDDLDRQPLLDNVDIFGFLSALVEVLSEYFSGVCGNGSTDEQRAQNLARSIVNGKRSKKRRKRRRASWRENRVIRVGVREAGSKENFRALGGVDLVRSTIKNTANADLDTLRNVLA